MSLMRMKEENNQIEFNVCYVSPIFSDVAETVRYGIAQLGYRVQCGSFIANNAINILLGSHQLVDWKIIPKNSIIYNLEQMGAPSRYLTESYIQKLREFAVWDYSERNLAWLKNNGINPGASLVPIGYVPTLTRISGNEAQDIDVLFYGWVNERRKRIIDELVSSGLRVVALHNSFGTELDQYISRSKVIVNIHFYETKIFEIVRVSYLWANKKAVVSEIEPDTEIAADLREAVMGVPYGELVNACRRLVIDEAARHALEVRAFELFSAQAEAVYLKPALESILLQAPLSAKLPPAISVIIPCYNQAQFLREAVESVIAQSYRNFEIIIVNDGSPDNTSDVARALIALFPETQIRLLEKTNGGIASARNSGISKAIGEYILPLDADDRIHPEMLMQTYTLLREHPELSIAYTDYQHFGDVDLVVRTAEYDFKTLYSEKCLFTATALFRKKAWEDAGGYNPNMIWGTEDWDFWIACGNSGHFGKRIPEVLFYYRTRLQEESRIKVSKQYTEELFARMFLNHRGLYDSARILWAKKIWAEALIAILDTKHVESREVEYLRNLDEMQLISEAEILIVTGNNSSAARLYKLWLDHAKSPLTFAIYFNLGACLEKEKKYDEARWAYRKSIGEKADFSPSILNLNRLNNCNNFGVSWLDIEFDFECEIHHCAPRGSGSATAFKVLNLSTEPGVWCISSAETRKIAGNFDLILTYRDDLLDLPNARFMVYGGCFVSELPQVKRFEVSFLYSVGLNNDMPGYALRKNIWEARGRLTEKFRYHSSAIRPPAEKDNPWPYKTKDKLFESMFSLIIENTSEKNYFTEKVIDAFQTYTVPIYWGCPNISDYFDPDGIICFSDLDELEQIIRRLTVADYYSRLGSIHANYKKSNEYKHILANMKREIVAAHSCAAPRRIIDSEEKLAGARVDE